MKRSTTVSLLAWMQTDVQMGLLSYISIMPANSKIVISRKRTNSVEQSQFKEFEPLTY